MNAQALLPLAIFSLALSHTPVLATEFSCDIANKNRTLTLKQSGNTISYAYGKKNTSPELALTVPVSAVELFSWEGIGRYHNYTIGVPNGQHLYTVYKSIDSREATLTHGVNIEKNGNFLADLVCDPATVKGDLEGWVLELKGE